MAADYLTDEEDEALMAALTPEQRGKVTCVHVTPGRVTVHVEEDTPVTALPNISGRPAEIIPALR